MQMVMQGFATPTEHLLAELDRLELMLQREALIVRAAKTISEDEFLGLLHHESQPLREDTEKLLTAVETLNDQIVNLRAANRQRAAASGDLPLLYLERTFGLTPFELDLLILAAAPEIDLRYETLFTYLQHNNARQRPTVDLALKLLCERLEDRPAALQMIRADAPLFRYRLLNLSEQDGGSELARTLTLDRRVVDFLCAQPGLDERLLPFAEFIEPGRATGHIYLPAALQAGLERSLPFLAQGIPALLVGAVGTGRLASAASVCAQEGRGLLRIDLRQALAPDRPFAALVPLLWREALLSGCGLYFDHFDLLTATEDDRAKAARLALIAQLGVAGVPTFLASSARWQPEDIGLEIPSLCFEFPLPDFTARLRLWEQALEPTPLAAQPELAALASKFTLTPRQIIAAARDAEREAVLRGAGAVDADSLHAAARAQSSQGLSRLSQKVAPFYTWTDLIVPARVMQQLQEICASVKFRHVVYRQWGFERKLALGKGLNVLFSGPSGTGKTMSAQIIAGELQLDLYKVDLAGVISKYIGETEKNLGKIFTEAEHSNAILFFDEADALFGKRSEVKDAHDRYANVEVAYLLQKMEEYEGVVILATNLGKNLDDAFARRMHHTVEFPFPDPDYRERIWRAVFPTELPLGDDVNLRFLARQFELAGGAIRNAALAASFMAAEAGDTVNMRHLIRAVAREYQKLGKLPAQADFRQYYDLIGE
jgi:hypothetical protein